MSEERSRSLTRQPSRGNQSSSSASTSPERQPDDVDSVTFCASNDSQSSIAASASEEIEESLAREIEERCRVSPICRLPAELMIAIFQKLPTTSDLRNCMLVSRDWARNSVALLWHRPHTGNWTALKSVAWSISSPNAFFDYDRLVKRLNLSSLGSTEDEPVNDGTLDTFKTCKRIERLTLTGCSLLSDSSLVKVIDGNRSLMALDVTGIDQVTDKTMLTVAKNCFRLQGLNITNCRQIYDGSLAEVAQSCRHLKRLKFNGCNQLTDKSIIAFATHCRHLLEIDLADCYRLEDEAVTSLINLGQNLRELRLAHCLRITDYAFLNLPRDATFDSLRILDLTDCRELGDAGVQKIVAAAPRLRNLVLAKCRQITDRSVVAITRLAKNLHYIHLGHCSRITDAGVQALVTKCTRIRFIDLACCTNLTDQSVTMLANLPKLKRIGLVKCGNITDTSIHALAKPKPHQSSSHQSPSSLERVHLSYCTNLTLVGILRLLNNCPRLTHLSLTGVQAFLHEELLQYCRSAPDEFNDHQRDVFCVFSADGVSNLREHLNNRMRGPAQNAAGEGTMWNPDGGVLDDGLIDNPMPAPDGLNQWDAQGAALLQPPPPPMLVPVDPPIVDPALAMNVPVPHMQPPQTIWQAVNAWQPPAALPQTPQSGDGSDTTAPTQDQQDHAQPGSDP